MKQGPMSDADVEKYLRGVFERNYQRLRIESGHALSPDVKETALQQVLFYWRKLRDLAKSITDTEVRLHLPNQMSKGGKRFGVEGVVDIVREEGCTTMYDLKTHDPEYVRKNIHLYEEQLNVYAYVWKTLREQELSETAVITTQFPDSLSDAIRSGNPESIGDEVENWQPVIPIRYNPEHVDQTIADFGKVVDAIENGEFNPPKAEYLGKEELPGKTFAARMCRNCDIRFSCGSFTTYLKKTGTKNRRGPEMFLVAGLTEDETEERFEAGLAG